jgi:hypothetical protein
MAAIVTKARGRRFAGRFGIGFAAAAATVFFVWLVEPVPASPYEALRLVPSSLISYLVPVGIAVLAAAVLRGRGVAGALVGAMTGFLLAAQLAAPSYTPHIFDELDGVWRSWYFLAGFRTIILAAVAGLGAWAIAGIVRRLGGHAQGGATGASSPRSP